MSLDTRLRELEKELSEVKDQNTALQSQLTEYAGVISDQSKVIQSGKVHDSEYVRLQQHNIHLAEFLKKQQLEYEEGLSSLKKKISHASKLGDENLKIHQLNVNLTAELEDYRTQTKRLLADLQQKDAKLAEKETEVDQLRQHGAYYSSSSSDRDKMELDMLRQKCDAWREEVEKLAPLRDEVGHLHTHASVLEEEIKFLKADNAGLEKQLLSVTEESDRIRREAYRKAPPDYDNLRDRLTELRMVRVQLESELIPLREGRAVLLTENARLREGAQPERYAKLLEEHVALDGHCRQVQIALDGEKALVLQLQQQLSEATTSGSDKLQAIHERMERYRQERDGAKLQTEELQWQLQRVTEELQHRSETSESNIEQLQDQLSQYKQDVSALTARAQDNEARMHRYHDEHDKAKAANQTLQKDVAVLSQTVQSLNDELQSRNRVTTETMQKLSDIGKEKDVRIQQLQQQLSDIRRENEGQVRQLQQSLTQTTQQLSDVRREKDAQIQLLQQRLGTTLSHTHSQEIEFWRVSPEEVQVDQEVIGRGAWGYVSRGTFRRQKVAVKKVYPDILKPHTVDRICREIRNMALVRHPNLVLFIAAVLDDRTGPMIITEILDTNLRIAYEENRLGSNKLHVFRDVASALNYLHLHREPIIHRDVSAANVLLEAVANDVWKAKLSDFGSANLVRFATTPGEGAIIYTAPEAFPQHPRSRTPPPPQTPKIDVYGYGVLVGEVVTQELPDPDELQEMVQQVQRQWPQIYQLVTSSIEYSPDDRPTMAYILEELEKLTP